MKPKKRKELYNLIEQHTRCEIMSRLAPIGWPECGDYHFKMIEKMDEIRKLMFGTSNLVALGQRWGLLKEINDEKERRAKQELRGFDKTKSKNKSNNKSHICRSLRNC